MLDNPNGQFILYLFHSCYLYGALFARERRHLSPTQLTVADSSPAAHRHAGAGASSHFRAPSSLFSAGRTGDAKDPRPLTLHPVSPLAGREGACLPGWKKVAPFGPVRGRMRGSGKNPPARRGRIAHDPRSDSLPSKSKVSATPAPKRGHWGSHAHACRRTA